MQQQVSDLRSGKMRGQALIEYVLILTLLALALAAVLVTTSAAVGNVFSNTVYNLIGQDPDAIVRLTEYGGPDAFWQTVTWVAEHPQQMTPLPTAPRVPTAEPTDGPSPEPSPTVPTPIPTATPSFTPSPTALDEGYDLPFVENVDSNETLKRWRLDNSIWLGGSAWKGEYYPNYDFTSSNPGGVPDYNLWNYQLDRSYAFTVNFDWGTSGYPIQVNNVAWPQPRSGDFSIRYTRELYVDATTSLRFTMRGAGAIRLILDGSTLINQNPTSLTNNVYYATANLQPAGNPHTLVIEYAEPNNGGDAGVMLDITLAGGSTGQINPDDTVDTNNANSRCNWGRTQSTNSNSLQWMFDEDVNNSSGAGPSLTCYLELRGYVNLEGATNPVMTFWDVWDFTGSSASAKLQLAEYTPVDGSPNSLDRSQLNWVDVALHSSGTANYNWTRQEIDLAALGLTDKKLTLRFAIQNTGGTSGNRRWYIDDIRIANEPPVTGNFTIGDFWDLNDTAQKDDFITDPQWNLTSNITYGSGLAWDDSPGYSTYAFTQGTPRVHYVELKKEVSLVGAPAADLEGDEEEPILSFWHTYNINTGTRLEVEWSRSPRNDVTGTADTWTRLGTAALVEATSSPVNGGQSMSFVELPLEDIPNWQTLPFRLRFAMYVNSTSNYTGTNAGGWYIDNIYIERATTPGYADYPFSDDAENATFTTEQWMMSGNWARMSGQGRRSGNAYTDSPSGDYLANSNTYMQMMNWIDLNDDTPEHETANTGGTAVKPTLTFWHWRDLASNSTFYVDMFARAPGEEEGAWHTIWQFAYNNTMSNISASVNRQEAWERVQLDLEKAYQDATGVAWSTVTGNGAADYADDDVRLRFRLNSAGSSAANGVFVDDIRVENFSSQSWRLWSGGDGTTYTDDIEGQWWDRWHTGGDWTVVNDTTHGGLNAFTDGDYDDYRSYQASVLEMQRIIDLTGTTADDKPVMYFWMLRRLHSSDNYYVQISRNDSGGGGSSQAYDRVYGWTQWANLYSSNSSGVRLSDAWNRIQVDLTPYVGYQIKIRFVFDTTNNAGGVSDGLYIDDVRFTFLSQQRIFTLGFLDPAQSTYNWVAEGTWGLAPDRYRGSGGGSVSFGTNPWDTIFISCAYTGSSTCHNRRTSDYNSLLDYAATNPPATNLPSADPSGDVIRGLYNEPMVLSFADVSSPANRPLSAADDKWNNYWLGYMTRRVTVVEASAYTFSVIANDAARAKINGPIGAPANQQINPSDTWNIANLWGFNNSTRQGQVSRFLQPGDYDITLAWGETYGSAFVSFTVSNNNFSFTDSPNTPDGLGGFTTVNSPRFADASLMLDGSFDLTNYREPVLEFYTQYALGPSNDDTYAYVEVSKDGGFTWVTSIGGPNPNDLGDDLCGPSGCVGMDWPIIRGGSRSTWTLRRHNLTPWAGLDSNGVPRAGYGYLAVRFRLSVWNNNHDGWYITDIRVNE